MDDYTDKLKQTVVNPLDNHVPINIRKYRKSSIAQYQLSQKALEVRRFGSYVEKKYFRTLEDKAAYDEENHKALIL